MEKVFDEKNARLSEEELDKAQMALKKIFNECIEDWNEKAYIDKDNIELVNACNRTIKSIIKIDSIRGTRR